MRSNLTEHPVADPLCRYRIEETRKLHIEEYAGRVGLDDLREAATTMASDPASSENLNRLIDLSHADLDLSSDDVLRFGLMMRKEGFRSKGWYAFAVGTASNFSLVRMLSHWARTSEQSRIFESREEAERWLDRNVGHMPPGYPVRSVA